MAQFLQPKQGNLNMAEFEVEAVQIYIVKTLWSNNDLYLYKSSFFGKEIEAYTFRWIIVDSNVSESF